MQTIEKTKAWLSNEAEPLPLSLLKYLHMYVVFLPVTGGEPPYSHQQFYMSSVSTMNFVPSSQASGTVCGIVHSLSSFFLPLDIIVNTIQYTVVKKKNSLTYILLWQSPFLCSSFNY